MSPATKTGEGSWVWFLTFVCLAASTVEPILIKLGYLGNATTAQLLVIRGAVAGACVLPFAGRIVPVLIAQIRYILPACVLFILTNVFLMLAFAHLKVSIVVALVTSTPAFVALVNQWRGTVDLDKWFWLGFLLCFVGIPITIGSIFSEADGGRWEGMVYVGLAVLGSTVYRTQMDITTRHVKATQVSGCLFLVCGVAAWVCLPFLWPLPPIALGLGGVIGLTSVVANLSFLATLAVLGSTRASILGLLQRPTVIVASALVLREPLTTLQVTGIALVLVGVYLAKPKPVTVSAARRASWFAVRR